jgi:hypothetical protein
MIEVDERDIADVVVGQQGSLMLSAFPSEIIDVTVEKIYASVGERGRNFFGSRRSSTSHMIACGRDGRTGKVEIIVVR